MNSSNKKYYFSIVSGEIYQLVEEFVNALDTYQIPLTKKPPTTCKKCFGRLHIGYDHTQHIYKVCPKCITKCLDTEKAEDIVIETQRLTNDIEFVDLVK